MNGIKLINDIQKKAWLRIFLVGFVIGAILPLVSNLILPPYPSPFWAFFPPVLFAPLPYALFGVAGLLMNGIFWGLMFVTLRKLFKRSTWWILVFALLYATMVYWLYSGWLDLEPEPLILPEW